MSEEKISQKKRLGKNIVYTSIGNFGSKLLTFVFLPVYTYALTTTEYGISDLITTIVSLCLPVFSLIADQALLRFALDKEYDKCTVYSIGMSIYAAGSLAFLLCSPLVLLVPTIKDYYLIFVMYYFSYGLFQMQCAFVQGCEKLVILSLSGIINTITTIVANIVFLLIFQWGINGYMLASILGNTLAFIFMFFATTSWKYIKCFNKKNYKVAIDMLRYSIPMMPNSISWWVSNFAGRYFVSIFCGVAANGIFSVACKIPTIISVVSGIFMSAWRISAVYKFQSDDSRDLYAFAFKYLYMGCILCASMLLVLNKVIAKLLYSNEFYVAWKVVPILLLGAVFHVFSEFYGTIYTSAKITKFLMQSSVIGAVINIVMCAILTPICGISGAATATMISYLVIYIIRINNSKKIISFHVDKLKMLISLGILVIQMILASMDFENEAVVCFVGFLAVLMLFSKDLMTLFMSVFVTLRKKAGRQYE